MLREKEQRDEIPLNLETKLIQSSVDGIVAVDEKGNVLLFNKGAERLWGYDHEEVVHRIHVEELYPPRLARDEYEVDGAGARWSGSIDRLRDGDSKQEGKTCTCANLRLLAAGRGFGGQECGILP